MAYDYTNLRRLLEAEPYPHRYLHKVIGRTTAAFEAGVAELELRFPRAERTIRRESRPPGTTTGDALYVAYTWELLADNPDEILVLLQFTETLVDAVMVL